MVATCGVGAMMYVLPMLLGRTYDMKTDSVGIDIFDQKDIDDATNNPIPNPEVRSYYLTVQDASEKRNFLGISGDMALKVSSGLVDIRGAGEYLRDTSNADKSVEILIKMTFTTQIRGLSPDAKPLSYWETRHPDLVGTHVVTDIVYGGEVYASVNLVAKKQSYLQEIKSQVDATLSKQGAFDIDAQGKMEMLAQNVSNKAKMEIDYYGTVPLDDVPTTIEGLRNLVAKFRDQVQRVNNGVGVAICAGFRPLSDFNDKFSFLKNKELMDAVDEFNYKFENLRVAKSILRSFVGDLPEDVPDDYMEKIMDFSERLSNTLNVFQEVIANLNMEEGSGQLSPADKAFDDNSRVNGVNKYTKEIKMIISEFPGSENIIKPRAVYTHWGKRTCDNPASNIVYIGYMASDVEVAIGAGTNYQCLPENPKLKIDFDTTGLNAKTSKLAAVRFSNMSMFKRSKQLQDKVVPCVVCETPMRPTVKMFPGMSCPGDWIQEYSGYLASNANGRMRAENVCINSDPDTYNTIDKSRGDPVLTPVKIGKTHDDKLRKDASVPCTVCSK